MTKYQWLLSSQKSDAQATVLAETAEEAVRRAITLFGQILSGARIQKLCAGCSHCSYSDKFCGART